MLGELTTNTQRQEARASALIRARRTEYWIVVDTRPPVRALPPPWDVGRQDILNTLERAVRRARATVDGLPDGFRFHDLRHFLASLLIAAGADVKVVQTRLRHASATTTLNTYAHMWSKRSSLGRSPRSGA